MTFRECHALDVSLPSAVLLVEQLFPLETGRARRRLVELLTDYFLTAIRAYVEFAPPQPVPEPSSN